MADEGGGGGGVPEWVVTFGDMMSLLLTFFIMLVSFSETRSEEKYQALMDSFQQQFGYHDSRLSVIPGQARPRNSALSKIASMGRAKRLDVLKGGAKVKAPVGDHELVTMVRAGKKTSIGIVLYFQEQQIELDDNQRALIREQLDQLRGKPQKIEIRGHTSNRPAAESSRVRDNWDLSFERCRQVMQCMIDEHQIDPRRIRLSVASANEPLHMGTDMQKLLRNPRVEMYLLDELVQDTTGTEEEQQSRFVKEENPPMPSTGKETTTKK